MGFLGFFFPLFYAFLPVHEADICLCQFYQSKVSGWRYPALTANDFTFLEVVNLISVNLVNIFWMLALIFMVYKIRHINDVTKIKMECSVIVCWWLFLNIAQFTLFSMLQMQRCHSDIAWSNATTIKLSYCCIILRNVVTMCITLFYQEIVNREHNLS